MEFKFRSYKKPEFESTLRNIRNVHNIGAGNVATFNDDGGYVTAVIPDEVILEFTEEEIDELSAIQ